MEHQPIITIDGLTKRYKGTSIPAVNGVSLSIEAGDFFGLLGPNGAGKTTTISVLCGLLKATSGEVKIDGHSISKNKEFLKQIIGVVPQEIALFPSLTARENLMYFGQMYGLEKQELTSRVNDLLEVFGLSPNADRFVETYSGGMKRRTNLIAGILHAPKVLFLDEPTVGVDVQSKSVITNFLKDLNKSGTTIIYTSHHLKEAENLCKTIAIIDNGKIIAHGRPQEMVASHQQAEHLEDVFLELTGTELRD